MPKFYHKKVSACYLLNVTLDLHFIYFIIVTQVLSKIGLGFLDHYHKNIDRE